MLIKNFNWIVVLSLCAAAWAAAPIGCNSESAGGGTGGGAGGGGGFQCGSDPGSTKCTCGGTAPGAQAVTTCDVNFGGQAQCCAEPGFPTDPAATCTCVHFDTTYTLDVCEAMGLKSLTSCSATDEGAPQCLPYGSSCQSDSDCCPGVGCDLVPDSDYRNSCSW